MLWYNTDRGLDGLFLSKFGVFSWEMHRNSKNSEKLYSLYYTEGHVSNPSDPTWSLWKYQMVTATVWLKIIKNLTPSDFQPDCMK